MIGGEEEVRFRRPCPALLRTVGAVLAANKHKKRQWKYARKGGENSQGKAVGIRKERQ